MNPENPYAAPKTSFTELLSGSCSRDGKSVYVPAGHDLPPRCIVCNAPAQMPIKERTMYWHSPWLYLLIFVNIFIYGLIALIVRKKSKVSPGYCAVHQAARRNQMYWLLTPSVGLMVLGVGLLWFEQGPLGLVAFVLSLLFLILALIFSRTIRPVRIDKEGAKYAGCKEPFLASLESP